MRLHPKISLEEAQQWLLDQATATFDVERSPELEEALRPFAESMAAVSAVELPDDLEPLFP